MSFQYIINYAESISIDRKKIVSQTQSRDGTIRSVARGGQIWRFEVKVADGIRWTDLRRIITLAEALDRNTSGTFQLNSTGYASWLSKYQGDSVNYTGFYGGHVAGSTQISLSSSPTTSSGYKFRAGDWIQIGSSGGVYTVVEDVAYNSNSVNLNRPILDATSSGYNIKVGPDCTFNVICTEYPKWTIFSRDQVSWDGPFVFYESLT